MLETLRLRVQDIDFNYHYIRIWQGKGNKNRTVTLAKELVPALIKQISQVEGYFEHDSQNPHYNGAYLPYALMKKYPDAPYNLQWHYLFPAKGLSIDPENKALKRHHIHESNLRKTLKVAKKKEIFDKPTFNKGTHSNLSKTKPQLIYVIHHEKLLGLFCGF